MQQITDTISGLSDKAGEMVNSEDFKKILPYLLTGGAGAVVGGLMTDDRRRDKNESRLSHLGRVLTNALLVGGGAAGATALLSHGKEKLLGSADQMQHVLNKDNEGPASSMIRSIAFSTPAAVGAGAAGLGLTSGMSGILGSGSKERAAALAALAKKIGISEAELSLKSPSEIAALNLSGSSNRLRQAAGLGSGDGLRGVLSMVGRKGLSTFGQTWPKRTVRGAVGLTAAAIPALLGAALTKDPNEPVS